MKKLPLIVAALFLPALALQAEDNVSLFDKLDSNQDGQLSKEEAMQEEKLAAVFDLLDTDQDGAISLSEYKAQISG